MLGTRHPLGQGPAWWRSLGLGSLDRGHARSCSRPFRERQREVPRISLHALRWI